MRRLKLLLPCLLLLALVFGAVAQAQEEESLQMTVFPSLQGRYVPGQAIMLRVRLENEGPDLSGEVRVLADLGGVDGVYSTPMSLPRHSRKEVPIIVGPIPRLSPSSLRVLFVADGKTHADVRVPLSAIDNDAYAIGLLVSDPAPLSFLSGIKNPTTMLSLTQADIPELVWPLRNLDLLVLAGVDTSAFNSGQRQALAHWIGSGGHLLVAGGPNAGLTVAGLPEGLLPVSLEGETTLETLPNLEQLANEAIPPTGPYLVTQASALTGFILVKEQGIDLIATRSYGLGRVTFLALDPTLAPLRSWAGNEALWERMLSSDPRADTWRRPIVSTPEAMITAIAQEADLRLPSMWGIGALLLLYIILVGPVNYIVLRRRGRLELAWATIPLLTLLFAVSVYAVGSATRGGNRALTTISVVRMAAGGPVAVVDTYAGIFSPRKQTYSVAADPEAVFGPMPAPSYGPFPAVGGGALNVVQTESHSLQDFVVDQWSMRSFTTRSILDPAPAIRAEVQQQGNQIKGSFANFTGTDLEDCLLMQDRRRAALGDLPAGQTLSHDVTLGTSSSPLIVPYSQGHARDEILASIFGWPTPSGSSLPQDLSLVCWANISTISLNVRGSQTENKAQTLFIIAVEPESIAASSPLAQTRFQHTAEAKMVAPRHLQTDGVALALCETLLLPTAATVIVRCPGGPCPRPIPEFSGGPP